MFKLRCGNHTSHYISKSIASSAASSSVAPPFFRPEIFVFFLRLFFLETTVDPPDTCLLTPLDDFRRTLCTSESVNSCWVVVAVNPLAASVHWQPATGTHARIKGSASISSETYHSVSLVLIGVTRALIKEQSQQSMCPLVLFRQVSCTKTDHLPQSSPAGLSSALHMRGKLTPSQSHCVFGNLHLPFECLNTCFYRKAAFQSVHSEFEKSKWISDKLHSKSFIGSN